MPFLRFPSWRAVRIATLALVVLLPLPSRAQILDGPIVRTPNGVPPAHVATGRDGSTVVIGWRVPFEDRMSQRFSAGSLVPSAPVTLPGVSDLTWNLAALAGGGYAVSWMASDEAFNRTVTVQRLTASGALFGSPVAAGAPTNSFGQTGLAPLGDGFVVGWVQDANVRARRFGANVAPLGPVLNVGSEQQNENALVAAVPGAFLEVWGLDDAIEARLYDAAEIPLTSRFQVATSFTPIDLAVNAAGTLAAVVGLAHADDPSPGEARARFFAPDGTFVGSDVVLGPASSEAAPRIAVDRNGNFLIAWGPPIRVRAFDAGGAALGPAVSVTGAGTPVLVNVAPRSGLGFTLLWTTTDDMANAADVTLCVPGTSVCGDGTLAPTCELCDDGAANSDTTPDACRTTCAPARCGDGVTDAGEECDDGNLDDCDGCSQVCRVEAGAVCGDGVVAPVGCSEQCDDANTTSGDGCTSACQNERIPGGGKPATDCVAVWRVDNPSNDPRYDKRGNVNPRQACADGDPACDFDGGVAGACTFHVAVCVNNSMPACTPGRLRSWTLTTPNAKQAANRPALAAVRAELASAVLPTVVGTNDPDRCSPDAAVVVPLRGAPGAYKAGKLTLKTRSETYQDAVDTDALQLRCNP